MSIRFRYVIALFLTGSLITLSFVVLYGLIEEQKQDAEIINMAGQQRMLSQRITLLVSSINICDDESSRTMLENAITIFQANHTTLTTLAKLPQKVQDTYFGAGNLDEKVTLFIENAKRVAALESCAEPPITITDATRLLAALDDVVTLFEINAMTSVDRVLNIETYLWLATLVLLLLEAMFIFTPMEKSVKSAFEKLTSLKETAEQAALQAQKASKSKSEFLSSMSHELRTPMNGLFGMIELAIDHPEKSNIYLKKAKSAGRQLLVLINDILDISKIEAGKIKIEQAPVDLLQVLDDVVSLQRVYCQRKGLAFFYNKDPDLPHVIKGDVTRIAQILHNLLSNAIKFTSSGSVTLEVLYKSSDVGNEIHFNVIDTGIGIEASKINRVFEKFEQADQTTTREFGGTGLGLSIAKQLAKLMQGDITLESVEGEGSAFSFRMPAHKSELPKIEVKPCTSLRCAIVDDLQTSREYFDHVVTSLSISSDCYENAQSFLEGDPLSYDIILLDLSMPEVSGIDLLKALKKLNPERFPLVILISAELERLEGETDVMSLVWKTHAKPINRRELENDLNNLVENKQIEDKPDRIQNKKKRILLAEDNEINAEIVKAILQEQGYTFLHVKNGQDAITACKNHRFDLILMDCNMPVMGGIEASIYLRNTLKTSLPIVALTANAFAEDKEECLKAGMDDFLAKPLEKETLLLCLKKHLTV